MALRSQLTTAKYAYGELRRLWVESVGTMELRHRLAKRGVYLGRSARLINADLVELGAGVIISDFGHVSAGRGSQGIPSGRVVLGDHAMIGRSSRISAPAGHVVRIGRDTSFYQAVSVTGDVTIGSHCIFSANIFVGSGDHLFSEMPTWLIRDQDRLPMAAHHSAPVGIDDDCWIGWGAVITRGAWIGRGAIVGANSVVTRDIPPYALAAGVPAKIIGKRLDFAPPTRLSALEDNDLPYFYSGFALSQEELRNSRRDRYIAAAYPEVGLALPTDGADRVTVCGIAKPMAGPIHFEARCNGTLLSSFVVEGSPWSVNLTLPRFSPGDAGPFRQFRHVILKLLDPSATAEWGIVSVECESAPLAAEVSSQAAV